MSSEQTSVRSKVLIAVLGRNSPAKLVQQRKTFLLCAVPRPFPTTLRGRPIRHGMRNHWAWPFVRFFGREWYFPSMLDVWRKGDEASIRFWPTTHLRRWLFTRCESCGERLPYGKSGLIQLEHEHAPRTKSVVLGQTGIYHMGCPPDPRAEYSSTDAWDRQWGHDDGLRRHVLHEPVDIALELSMLAQRRRQADEAYRRRLIETRRELGYDKFRWKLPRTEETCS